MPFCFRRLFPKLDPFFPVLLSIPCPVQPGGVMQMYIMKEREGKKNHLQYTTPPRQNALAAVLWILIFSHSQEERKPQLSVVSIVLSTASKSWLQQIFLRWALHYCSRDIRGLTDPLLHCQESQWENILPVPAVFLLSLNHTHTHLCTHLHIQTSPHMYTCTDTHEHTCSPTRNTYMWIYVSWYQN